LLAALCLAAFVIALLPMGQLGRLDGRLASILMAAMVGASIGSFVGEVSWPAANRVAVYNAISSVMTGMASVVVALYGLIMDVGKGKEPSWFRPSWVRRPTPFWLGVVDPVVIYLFGLWAFGFRASLQ
jgi:hypothetical protein